MNLAKWNLFLIVMITLISIGIQLPSKDDAKRNDQSQRRYVPNQTSNAPSYWEHILREFVFKTISPPPPGNHNLYKRLLYAPFYGGPFPIVSNDASSVVLSRGDVYYLPNGDWLLCQQGCTDCEVCNEHTHPTVKWVLRRIKRVSTHGSTRHDLQLTIVPQIDGSYHMRSLWPRSYVYVTSQGEQDAYLSDKHSYRNDGSAYLNAEDNASGQKGNARNFWTVVDKNSWPERHDAGHLNNDSVSSISSKRPERNTTEENIETTTAMTKKNNTEEQTNNLGDGSRKRSGVKFIDKQGTNDSLANVELKENERSNARPLVPKLILGTDQSGQKHLVHVVPAEIHTNADLMNSLASGITNSSSSNRTAYQRIFRRIFDSLKNNRKSIENFLEPLKHRDRGANEAHEDHVQQETRNVFAGLRQTDRLRPIYSKGNRTESSLQKRRPYTFNWSRDGRGSNGNEFTDRLINNTIHVIRNLNNNYTLGSQTRNSITNLTFHPDIRDKNTFEHLRSKLIELIRDSNNTFGTSFRNNNITLNKQDDQFSPPKYKIVISSESTTQSGAVSNHNEN